MTTRGYREVEHTADWTLEVWGPSFEALCEEAIQGMSEMSGLEIEYQRDVRTVSIEGADREEKLVGLLSEVLYLQQADRFGASESTVTNEATGALEAELMGGPVASVDKEIKAVTWYDLDIVTSNEGVRAKITFDV